MAKGLIRKVIAGTVVGAAVIGSLYFAGESIFNRLGNAFYVDPENPRGFETCYLSEKDVDLHVTTRDVGCRQVVYVDENNNPLGEPIFPKRGVALQDHCAKGMQRGETGMCEYFPPEYFEYIESEKQPGISI